MLRPTEGILGTSERRPPATCLSGVRNCPRAVRPALTPGSGAPYDYLQRDDDITCPLVGQGESLRIRSVQPEQEAIGITLPKVPPRVGCIAPRTYPMTPGSMLALQRLVGNRAVSQLLNGDHLPAVQRNGTKRKAAAAGLGRGGPSVSAKVRGPTLFEPPTYGNSHKRDGGDSVYAVVGPGAYDPTARGSGPGQGECTSVNTLNRAPRFQNIRWIKGHLLNENLGGPGISANLTPLTHIANKDHLNRFEKKAKDAIQKSQGRALYYKDQYWYGLEYQVRAVGQPYPAPANVEQRAIKDHLDCEVQWMKKAKGTGTVTAGLDAGAPASLRNHVLPAGVVRIPCIQL